MTAPRRSTRSGASSAKASDVPRNPVRPPQAKIQPGLPPPWEARLCELELRLARLEMENRELREAYRELEALGVSHAKRHDLAPIGLVTLEAQGTILDINRTGAALLGRDKLSLLKRRFAHLVAPEDIPKFTTYLRRCLRSRQMVSGELSLRKPDGGLVVVQFASMPVLDGESGVVQIETTLVDITDRKRTEKALRESEARLKAIMDNSPAMIFLKDTQGRYLHFNRQFEKVFRRHFARTT
jgi:PAS domain S-box-containing protein